ncbi:hypothetical protein D9613_012414 [Agrocybe pediades]|uniref:Uncharacterized protein n=1 Tax=Agrocybe pediades TaxID=84607 RepID=A0A8H4VPQ3_9AGAR|nr:hypothetical protein D9613_012414 [Agrocybe pediades]
MSAFRVDHPIASPLASLLFPPTISRLALIWGHQRRGGPFTSISEQGPCSASVFHCSTLYHQPTFRPTFPFLFRILDIIVVVTQSGDEPHELSFDKLLIGLRPHSRSLGVCVLSPFSASTPCGVFASGPHQLRTITRIAASDDSRYQPEGGLSASILICRLKGDGHVPSRDVAVKYFQYDDYGDDDRRFDWEYIECNALEKERWRLGDSNWEYDKWIECGYDEVEGVQGRGRRWCFCSINPRVFGAKLEAWHACAV